MLPLAALFVKLALSVLAQIMPPEMIMPFFESVLYDFMDGIAKGRREGDSHNDYGQRYFDLVMTLCHGGTICEACNAERDAMSEAMESTSGGSLFGNNTVIVGSPEDTASEDSSLPPDNDDTMIRLIAAITGESPDNIRESMRGESPEAMPSDDTPPDDTPS